MHEFDYLSARRKMNGVISAIVKADLPLDMVNTASRLDSAILNLNARSDFDNKYPDSSLFTILPKLEKNRDKDRMYIIQHTSPEFFPKKYQKH